MQTRDIPATQPAQPSGRRIQGAAIKTVTKQAFRELGLAALAGVAAALLVACTPGGNSGGSDPSGNGPVELGNYENAIKVSPTLDEERAVTQTIGFDGGTISATAADGTVFTLTIPADSVRQRTQITMTPVSKLDGLPFGSGTDVTVDLQPSGLVFDVPATLSIAPATPISAGEQILYGYSDDRLVFAEPVLKADGIAIVVPHFSGYGAAKGFMGDVEEARKRIGGSAEERITSEMRAVMQAAHQAEKRGEPPPRFGYPLQPYFEQYEREVIKPRLAAAGQSCAAGRSAIFTVLSYNRMRILLGYEDGNVMPEVADLLENTVGPKCMDEEYAMCVNEHIVHRIYPAYLEIARTLVLLDHDNSPAIEKMKTQVESCLQFELEFKLDTRFEVDTRSLNESYLSYAESTELTTRVNAKFLGEHHLEFEPSSGPMETLKPVYRHTIPRCVKGQIAPWSDTGHFLGLSWVVDLPDINQRGKLDSIEIELGLPTPVSTMSGAVCSGRPVPTAEWTAFAPTIYVDLHGDSFIRDWDIHTGNESIATTDWKSLKHYPPAGLIEDNGTATLRHTPR